MGFFYIPCANHRNKFLYKLNPTLPELTFFSEIFSTLAYICFIEYSVLRLVVYTAWKTFCMLFKWPIQTQVEVLNRRTSSVLTACHVLNTQVANAGTLTEVFHFALHSGKHGNATDQRHWVKI